MHELVARPAPGADEIDLMAVGHLPTVRASTLITMRRLRAWWSPVVTAKQRNLRAATPNWGLLATVPAA
jgi:hypothetical protein